MLAADGVDVVTIQKLMGHRDVKTTMKYLHAAPDRLRWAVENIKLDGTTQEEVDTAERREGIGAKQSRKRAGLERRLKQRPPGLAG